MVRFLAAPNRLLVPSLLLSQAVSVAQESHDPGAFDGPWVGIFEYMGESYDVTIAEQRTGEEPALLLDSSLLRSVPLFDYVSEDGRVTFEFDRSDTGPVEIILEEHNGVARGEAFARGQAFLRLCLVRDLDLDPARLEGHTGLYRFPSGAPMAVHTNGALGSDLFASLYASGEAVRLYPITEDRFVSELRFEGDSGFGMEFVFDGPQLKLAQDGAEQIGERQEPSPEPPIERIERAVRGLMEKRGIASLSIGLVHRDRLVYSRSFGFADREAGREATPETLYQLGSVMKPFTATLVAGLAEEGKLDWDDPVEEHLPEGVRLAAVERANARRITLRRLASHTSGLQRDSQMLRRIKEGPTVDDLHRALALIEQTHPVGEQQIYSNIGVKLLAHAAETVAGQPLEQVLRERLFDPLGMDDSTSVLDDDVAARLAVHYWPSEPARAPHPPVRFGAATGAGGLISNVVDMAKFVSWELGYGPADARLLPDEPRRRMYEFVLPTGSEGKSTGQTWTVRRPVELGQIVSHGGESDGHSAWIAFSPNEEVGVVVLANIGGNAIFEFSYWLFQEWIKERRRQMIPTIAAAEEAFAGDRFGEVVWSYRYLVDANPENGQAWYRLGCGHFGLRQLERAAICFERAIELGSETAMSHLMAARVQAMLGHDAAAVAHLGETAAAGLDDPFVFDGMPEFAALAERADYRALFESLLGE